MFDLARGITTEEAHASCFPAQGGRGKLRGAVAGTGDAVVFEVPVLAEKTVEGAGFVEYGEIQVPVLRSLGVGKIGIACRAGSGTHPISHTVRR